MSGLHGVAAGEELLDLVPDLGGQAVADVLGVGWLLDNGRESDTGFPSAGDRGYAVALARIELKKTNNMVKHRG